MSWWSVLVSYIDLVTVYYRQNIGGVEQNINMELPGHGGCMSSTSRQSRPPGWITAWVGSLKTWSIWLTLDQLHGGDAVWGESIISASDLGEHYY